MSKSKSMMMLLLAVLAGTVVFVACHSEQPSYCTVKGTVKGLKNGTRLDLMDEFNHYAIVGKGVVKNGAFEIHPEVTSPTHVYLYSHNDKQLKDFVLEPGTIFVEVDATDEDDYGTGATGTPSNDMEQVIISYRKSGDQAAADSVRAMVLNTNPAGPLALANIEQWCKSSAQILDVLDRLTPELAQLPYVDELRAEATQRLKTEAGGTYIDMEYPDVNGNLVSLSSVVNNPDNRYILVDFWATWCGGCLEKLPQMKEIYAEYHTKGLEIYGVSVNIHRKDWLKYLEKDPLPWINICDESGGKKGTCQVRNDYAIIAYPTTLLIEGQTGKILVRGGLNEIEATLAELLP